MKKIALVAALILLFANPTRVLAIAIGPGATGFTIKSDAGGCQTSIAGYDALSLACISQIVMNIVSLAISFLGLVTLVFLLWGAIRFATSAGDPKAIQSARNTMTYAIIGAVVVLGSFILMNVVTSALNIPNPILNFSIFQ